MASLNIYATETLSSSFRVLPSSSEPASKRNTHERTGRDDRDRDTHLGVGCLVEEEKKIAKILNSSRKGEFKRAGGVTYLGEYFRRDASYE
jgi:hypothetical protein